MNVHVELYFAGKLVQLSSAEGAEFRNLTGDKVREDHGILHTFWSQSFKIAEQTWSVAESFGKPPPTRISETMSIEEFLKSLEASSEGEILHDYQDITSQA